MKRLSFYRLFVSITGLVVFLSATVWAGESSPGPMPDQKQDPKVLRSRLVSFQDSNALQRFLLAQQLADPPPGSRLGFEAQDGRFVELGPQGLGVDLFYSNLFGDQNKEAILQIRFSHALYFIAFFYQQAGVWQRVPGVITMNREEENNTPCDPTLAPGEGYFYFSFVEARKPGEHVVEGQAYGGWCPSSGSERGSEVRMLIWQIATTGIHPLLDTLLYSTWVRSPVPNPIREPTSQRCTWVPASPATVFPKKLQCEVSIYEKREERQADAVSPSTPSPFPDVPASPTWEQAGTRIEVRTLSYVQ